MTPADRKRLVVTLTGVYGFFDRDLTEFAIRIWADALDGMPIADIEAAFSRHLRDTEAGKFLPKPADILRQLHGDAEERALIAWGSVLNAARAGGGFRPDHCPATREAVHALGGWSVLCRSDEREHGFMQLRFTELFRAYRRREDAPPLLGIDTAKVLRIVGGRV